jgi:hypothetical protein
MQDQRTSTLTWVSFAAAPVALAGSLWLSNGMNLKARPLLLLTDVRNERCCGVSGGIRWNSFCARG